MILHRYGLSGAIIRSASAHMKNMESGRYKIEIDLKPALDEKTLDARLLREINNNHTGIYADVISMHYYNSQYGFEKGNDLLKLVAKVLEDAYPEALVMRGPDDHFILIDAFESQEKTRDRILSTQAFSTELLSLRDR